MRDTAGKLNHFQPTLHISLAIGNHLSMLRRQKRRQLIHIIFEQIFEFKHDAGAPLRIGGGPFGLHFFGRFHGCRNIVSAAQANVGLHLARIGVENLTLTF